VFARIRRAGGVAFRQCVFCLGVRGPLCNRDAVDKCILAMLASALVLLISLKKEIAAQLHYVFAAALEDSCVEVP
jgi:hypothetical protein